MEAERDRDATTAVSSAAVVRAGQYRDQHAALLEACGGIIDVLSPAGVSVEDRLGNVPRQFTKVIQYAVRHVGCVGIGGRYTPEQRGPS